MNLTRIDVNSNESPFDSIRRYDEHGKEYWLARELMPLLNYAKWERFNGVIEVAIENLETVVENTTWHFFPDEGKTKGRPRLDYKLSRLACYHVALSCDSRGNNAVKMAKHYFAVKTREAEVVIPQQNEQLRELELRLEILKAEKEVTLAQQKLIDTRYMVTKTCPEPVQQKVLGYQIVTQVEEREVFIDKNTGERSDGVGVTYISKMFGFGTNTQKCWAWLEQMGYGKNSGKWQNELTAIHTPKLSRDDVQYLKDLFNDNRQGQQLFLGE
jgi:hypothetical protein